MKNAILTVFSQALDSDVPRKFGNDGNHESCDRNNVLNSEGHVLSLTVCVSKFSDVDYFGMRRART
jgi:hypothetical protein